MYQSFPALRSELAGISNSIALDGEIVWLDEHGRPQFKPPRYRTLIYEATPNLDFLYSANAAR